MNIGDESDILGLTLGARLALKKLVDDDVERSKNSNQETKDNQDSDKDDDKDDNKDD